jgi:hypothetical protein
MEEGVEEEEKKITVSSAVDEELDVYNWEESEIHSPP